MMKTLVILSTIATALAFSCGSDSTPAKTDAKVFLDGSGSGSGSSFLLTVKDAPTGTPWCSVTIGTNAASGAGVLTMPITASGPITLKVSANTGFKLDANMWHHTDGDTGTGDTGTVAGSVSTATVTVSATANKCVWVCCPGTSGTPACPTTEQCN
jgi:autotransporter translocation and assembly factor TamB